MTNAGGFSHFLSLIPADAPWWLPVLMIAGLALHIGGGSTAIVAGWGAVLSRKGSPRHIWFGRLFLGLIDDGNAAIIAPFVFLCGVVAAYRRRAADRR